MKYKFDKGGQNSIYDPTVVFGNNYMDIPQQEEAPDNAYTDYLQQRVKDNNSQEAFDFSSLIPDIPQEDIEKNQLYEKLFSLEQRLNNKEDNFIPPTENSDNVPYDWTKSNSHGLEKYGSAYTGLDPKVTQATEEMLNRFPNLRLTSGKRNWGDKDAHPIGRAVDLSYDQDAYDYYKNIIVPKYGFNRALDPHHGTGTHIHLGYYRNGGQWLDKYQIKGEYRGQVPTSDNLQYQKPIVSNFIVDPLSGGYVHNPARAAALLNQPTNAGTISKTKDRSVGKQIYNVATNPMTSAQQLINKQPVTGLGPKNPYDFAFDAFPAMMAARQLPQIPGNIQNGEYLQAGLNALSVIPFLPKIPRGLPRVLSEGQPYEGAPHIYEDMVPINGRYQPRTIITDAGVKNEILGLEATPVIPLNQIEYPVTSNKFLYQTYDDFGRMEEGLVGNTTPSTQESVWNNILKNSSENKKLPGSKTSYSIVRDSEGKIQFLDNETYRDALVTGKSNIVNYLSDPRYKAVVEGNQELANRLNMNRVLPIQKEMGNAGLHDARVAKINQPITILDPRSLETKIIQGTNEGVQAQYSRNLDGSGFINIPRVYDKTKTIKNVEHEALHHVYPNLGEGLPSFTPLEARKAKAVFKDNAALRKIEEENNIPFWYLDDVDELVPNSFDLANDLGIAKFQKYPGVESFKKMLESYTGGKKFIKDALKLDTPRDYKRAWDMLSGVRLGIVPAIGVGVALQQQKNGGAIITNRGQWDYPGQTTIIPSNNITMTGVDYPVLGVDNTGHTKMMQPGMDYTFPGQYVTEYPMMQPGGQNPPIYVTDPNDARLRRYQDSTNLYNYSNLQHQLEPNILRRINPFADHDKIDRDQYTLQKEAYRIKNSSRDIDWELGRYAGPGSIFIKDYPLGKVKKGRELDFYDPTLFEGATEMKYVKGIGNESPDLVHKTIKPKSRWWGMGMNNDYSNAKPVQPVVLQSKPSPTSPTSTRNVASAQAKIKPKKTSPSMQSLHPQKYNPMPEWEQRLYNGSKLRLNNDDGSYSSHKMMNWEEDGKYYAAPTIVNKNGKLIELSPDDAINYHREHNSAKEFNSDAEAMKYADNGYKDLSNVEKPYLPIPQMTLPQQKGKPIYGPGSTIIGYRGEDGKVRQAYQYTGAPNNELNLQDKALLKDKDKWQQYLSSRDSGYKFEDGEQKMQVGGFSLNPFVLPLLSPVTALVSTLFSKSNTQAPAIANASNASSVTNSFLPTSSYDKMADSYLNKRDAFYKKMNSNDYKEYKTSPNSINLSSGRFKGASVSPEMIDDIVKASKANNVDPWLMLSLVGRESTFGSGQESNKFRADNKRSLVSGWNVAEDYTPYGLDRYLADQKVPGIRTEKDNHGYQYYIDNQDSVDNYLKRNPQLIEKYNKKLESTPDIGNMDSFNLAAKRIKKKGIQNYNPGDPKYYDMVIQDMGLLKKDNALKTYMISKGYKEGGNVEMDYEDADLQDPYELELMKAGGVPDRYRNMGFTKVGAKKQSTRPGKKWMVLAKKGDDYKVVHGGYKGMQDFKQHHSEQRKENFWSRMGGRNSSKATDPFSPLYWHKRFGTWQEGGQNSIYDPTVVFGNNYADTPQQEEVQDNTYNDYLQQRLKNNNLQEDFDFSSLIPDVPQEDIEKKQLYERLFNLEQKINNSENDLVSITENSDNIPYDWTSNTRRKLNSSSFNYDDYRNKIDNYLKEKHPNAPVSGENFAKAAQESFFKTGKIIPVELVIAQAELESNFGTSGGRPTITKNIYNVGNKDDGSNNIQKDWQSGINKYYDLLSTKYLANKTPDDLLHNFVNTSGNRYASDKNYERKLKYLINNLD